MIETYEEALNFIHGRAVWKKTPSFNRIDVLLQKLDNPQQKITGIHITGTNGKGSTTAYLRDLLMNSGLTVGTFTSPFITRFNERISVNGTMISDQVLLELVQQIAPLVVAMDSNPNDGGPTEFEVITAMMFLYFAQHPVDIVLIEVGIGGLFDSTNVFKPLLSIITSVGFDHMHVLGNTLTAIAQQKAAIIKPGVPVIYGGYQRDEAGTVMLATAHQLQVPCWTFDDFNGEITVNEHLTYEKFTWQATPQLAQNLAVDRLVDLQIKMLGKYQVENASLAILAYLYLAHIGIVRFNEQELRTSLMTTQWPGRFEILSHNPLVVIDGAHNVAAVDGLVELLARKFKQYQKITIIFAALADKEFGSMADKLTTLPNVELIATEFSGPGKRIVVSENEIAAKVHHKIKTATNWQKALTDVMAMKNTDEMILVTGSLYFISEVRKNFLNL